MVVSHHGRPTKLDLDCSETLRCPLLSFPGLLAHRSHDGLAPYPTGEGLGDDDTLERTPGGVVDHAVAEFDGSNHQDGGQTPKSFPPTTPRTENGLLKRSAAVGVDVDSGSESPEDGDEGLAVLGEDPREDFGSDALDCGVGGEGTYHSPTGVDGSRVAFKRISGHGHENVNTVDPKQQQQHQHPHQQQHRALVPVQLVAVLVDGSGKGWMAARRLWSVGEVGFQALSETGLSAGDVDADQEVSWGIVSL